MIFLVHQNLTFLCIELNFYVKTVDNIQKVCNLKVAFDILNILNLIFDKI